MPSDMIRARDVNQLLRAIGETTEQPKNSADRQTFFARRLGELIGAVSTIYFEADVDPGKSAQIFTTSDCQLRGPHFSRTMMAYSAKHQLIDPSVKSSLSNPIRRIIATRGQLVNDKDWYHSDYYDLIPRKFDLDEHIHVRWYLPKYGFSVGFGIHREPGDRPFGRRERVISELICNQLDWLMPILNPGMAPTPAKQLTRTLRVTLLMLQQGLAEKTIAAKRGLSPHTIHDHVKRLHKIFGVHSRGELVAIANLDALEAD